MRMVPPHASAATLPAPAGCSATPWFELRFVADPLAVRAALAQVTRSLSDRYPDAPIDMIELVLAEAANNIVEHAYGALAGLIDLRLFRCGPQICVDMADQGRAMPDGHAPHPIQPVPTDLKEGGYGWFLIHTLAKEVRYHRKGQANILSFRMPLRREDLTVI